MSATTSPPSTAPARRCGSAADPNRPVSVLPATPVPLFVAVLIRVVARPHAGRRGRRRFARRCSIRTTRPVRCQRASASARASISASSTAPASSFPASMAVPLALFLMGRPDPVTGLVWALSGWRSRITVARATSSGPTRRWVARLPGGAGQCLKIAIATKPTTPSSCGTCCRPSIARRTPTTSTSAGTACASWSNRVGAQAAIVRRSIDRTWEDQSIETLRRLAHPLHRRPAGDQPRRRPRRAGAAAGRRQDHLLPAAQGHASPSSRRSPPTSPAGTRGSSSSSARLGARGIVFDPDDRRRSERQAVIEGLRGARSRTARGGFADLRHAYGGRQDRPPPSTSSITRPTSAAAPTAVAGTTSRSSASSCGG